MIHTVFFDAGGTLIDTPDFFLYVAPQVGGDETEVVAQFLKERFLDHYRDPSQPFRTVEQLIALVLRQAANSLGIRDRSASAGEIYRRLFLTEARLYGDALPALQQLLREEIRMIMISDADAGILYEEFDRLGIREFFSDYVISSEVGAYKPSDAIVGAARELCREPLDGIVLVGDTLADVHTAHKMGVGAVHIDRRSAPLERADHVITTLSALPDLVRQL